MGERNFEPNLGGDLWSMGFDVDLALDTHNTRKNNMGLSSVNGSSSSPMGSGGVNIGYGDMQHMLLHRFEDDLNEGDISQITDLTNSLPKGDSETAHSFLSKIACHDLTRELAGAQGGAVAKGIEANLFGAVGDASGSGPSTHALSQKNPTHPVDVYGRVSLFEGKLVLQLRHFNANTSYPVSVAECWLCREKMPNGSHIHSHKHVLQGLFQVNDEFVQMDIDHYIIPEQALEPDPSEVNRALAPAPMIAGASHSALAQHVGHSRALTLGEDMECAESLQGQHVNMGAVGNPMHTSQRPLDVGNDSLQTPKANSEIQYTETDLNNALNTEQQALNTSVPIDSHAFLNSFPTSELRMDSTTAASLVTSTNASSLMRHPEETVHSSSSFAAPAPLTSCRMSSSETVVGTDTIITNTTENHATLSEMETIHALCAPPESIGPKTDNFNQHTTYEPNIGTNKDQLDSYHNFFGPQYSYSYENNQPLSNSLSKFHVESQPVSTTELCPIPSNPPPSTRRNEMVGAKKRKSRAQKKPSSIRMKDERNKSSLNEAPIQRVKIERTDNSETSFSTLTLEGGGSGHISVVTNTSSDTREDRRQLDSELKETSSHTPKTTEIKWPAGSSKSNDSSSVKREGSVETSSELKSNTTKNLAENELKSKTNESSSPEMKCPLCHKTFQGSEKYTRHLKIHNDNRYFCTQCDAHYSRPDKLRRHVANMHDCKRPFVCNICSKSFSRMEYLKVHQDTHTGKKLECDYCHQLFSSQFNLTIHKKLHSTEKLPFLCEYCDKTFRRKDFLSSHVARDHKNKKFECDICAKLFSRNDVLKRHKVTHDEKRVTYDCDVCGKKFRRKDRLKTHSYEHRESTAKEGETKKEERGRAKSKSSALKQVTPIPTKAKFDCGICLKIFPSSVKLNKHFKKHEAQIALKVNLDKEYLQKSYKCHFCPKTFKREDLMARHSLKSHRKSEDKKPSVPAKTDKRKFFCDVCSKGFTRSYNLKTHLKTHTKNIPNNNNEDDEVLAELPTVLNASKSNLKRRRTLLTQTREVGESGTSGSILSQGTLRELPSSPTQTTFNIPLEEGFSPITSTHPPYSSHLPSNLSNDLPIPTTSFCNTSPNSPINLSTEAISAAAYLLIHPFYEGPYQ